MSPEKWWNIYVPLVENNTRFCPKIGKNHHMLLPGDINIYENVQNSCSKIDVLGHNPPWVVSCWKGIFWHKIVRFNFITYIPDSLANRPLKVQTHFATSYIGAFMYHNHQKDHHNHLPYGRGTYGRVHHQYFNYSPAQSCTMHCKEQLCQMHCITSGGPKWTLFMFSKHCLPQKSSVMVHYKTFHLNFLIFLEKRPPTGQITF